MSSNTENFTGNHLPNSWEKALVLSGKLVSGLLIKAFIFTLVMPVNALAFTEDTQRSWNPHMFERDEDLRNEAVVGIEAFSNSKHSIAAGSELTVVATAYSSSLGETDGSPSLTASGKKTRRNVIAANFLPLGTKVKINGSIYIVGDRMNSRYNSKLVIDFWFPTPEGAQNFGLRAVDIEVVSVPSK